MLKFGVGRTLILRAGDEQRRLGVPHGTGKTPKQRFSGRPPLAAGIGVWLPSPQWPPCHPEGGDVGDSGKAGKTPETDCFLSGDCKSAQPVGLV